MVSHVTRNIRQAMVVRHGARRRRRCDRLPGRRPPGTVRTCLPRSMELGSGT
ncbi:hypothetical protein I546_6093 [Mycobacterium kansasii 732]|nr:hypothetical protein I546_6093 [Mycobacterium kansasii 732]